MLKVGVSCYPTYGGSGVVASELAIELAERGHEVHVISYALPPRLMEVDAELPLRFHEVRVRQYPLFEYPPYSLALATRMVEVARTAELDVMHVHYAVPNAVSALLAQQILAPQRLPVVTTLHGTDVTLVGNDPSYLETTRWGVVASDAVTAVSGWLRDATIEQLQIECDTRRSLERPIEVVPNFVDTDRFRPLDDAERAALPADRPPVLLHVSNYRRVKRVLDVLEVFARVVAERPARLHLIGDGPERAAVEQAAREQQLTGHIDFVEVHPHVEEAVRRADVLLLASSQESFGLVALEAMASAVPVVATAVGGLTEVLRDGRCGLLYGVGDVAGMAQGALRLLDDEGLRREMGANGRQRALEFRPEAVVDRYEEIYRRVITAD